MEENYAHVANAFCRRAGLLFALALLVSAFEPAALAQSPAGPSQPLITQPVNEGNLVVLSGNTRPEAKNPANDRGIVADSMPMSHLMLQLRRPAAQEEALKALIDQLHDPKSRNFHHWLSASAFGAQFSPAASDIAAVTGWLRQHGFTVNVVYPSGMAIDFSGTAGQVRTAFHTEIHHLSVKGVAHVANTSDPQIPAALAPAVVGIVSLGDFKPKPAYSANSSCQIPDGVTAGDQSYYLPQFGSTCNVVTPADLATIYNFNPVFNGGKSGQGQTIYVIEDSDISSATDWTTFRAAFGLSGYSSGALRAENPAPPSGSNNCTDPGALGGAETEAALDAEWASAAAPSATIVVASCADTGNPGNSNFTFGGLIAVQNLLNSASPPAIISLSYNNCEGEEVTGNAAMSAAWQQGVAEGTSIFVAAGDQGPTGCDSPQGLASELVSSGFLDVNAFASTPYNVAVGGTDFSDTSAGTTSSYWNSTNSAAYGSAKSYVPEMAWNSSCASPLIVTAEGYSTPYGASGFCNDPALVNPPTEYSMDNFLANYAGSGGPSFCGTGSGNTCQGWPKPSWQSGLLGNPSDGVRDLPDVSLFAGAFPWNHAYIVCSSCSGPPNLSGQNGWGLNGGTSFAAPIWAGIQALINQKATGAQGLPNYRLYQLAAQEYGASGSSACNASLGNAISTSCIFYDVTLGNTSVPCKYQGGWTAFEPCYSPGSAAVGVESSSASSDVPDFSATTGWDFATGIGTVNVANLVAAWVGGQAPLTDAHDFNGDRVSDILWRQNGTGELAMWLMSNGQLSSGADVSQVPSTWSVVGTRDFNGDGKADILWQDTSGDLAVWLMNGAALSSGIGLGNVGTPWAIVGTGDFNDNGTGDILWRNTSTGAVSIWLMSNGAFSSGVDLGTVPLNWSVAGAGDFNGDGTTDILWRNTTTGDLAIWFLHNGAFSSGGDLGAVPLTWTVVGTGDFNGDGTSDILWRDTSGDLAIWLINNGAFSSGATLGQVSTTWSVAETGDFNGDGKSDILWLDQSGDLAVWLMNGTTLSSGLSLGNVGTSWLVQGQNAD